MNIASRIIRLPRPFDPDRGADTAAACPAAGGDLAALLAGAGGCSPYLHGLVRAEADWLGPALDDPEAAFDALMAALPDTPEGTLGSALRRAKRRVALILALCDLGGVWDLDGVTGRLSRFADLACALALRAAVLAEIRRGRLPGATEEDADTAGGMVVLAMGKLGAHELNYSSDIDLICLMDETRYEQGDFAQARSSLVRATRRMAAMLGDMTAEGYVFRTDLRLRPDPAVTPVCMSMAAAETYYESLGRTWERAAYIKARPAAGDIAAGERFLRTLRPFVWRRHLDFAAIQDAHDMRLRIREHKGLGGAVTLPGHDMKLGRGGIREIEFFTQTRQLIAGGRDRDLRRRGTVAGLEVLAEKEWIPHETAAALSDHYRAHREIEHRLQMVNDAQTHSLPVSDDGFERLAAMTGRERAALQRDLMHRLTEVHDLTEGFFAPDGPPAPDRGVGAPPDPEALPDLGAGAELMARWPSYPALRSSRATAIFRRLRPDILARLQQAARPDEALVAFDGFLAGLPAGVQLFSLFEANPQLIDLLVDIVGTAPALSRHLARNAQVFDAVIGGDFFAAWPGAAPLEAELRAALAAETDYERRLDAARRWGKEWHFRIGVHFLRGLIGAADAAAQYADLAEAMLRGLWPEVTAQFAARHGAMPGRGAVVLGMGSLGAGRLTPASDLDLIVIYDAGGIETSDGRRPLAARTYYARLTQALVTAMTAPMAEGRLYEVDMRLRPSGNQGPVATSWPAFQSYQRDEAWIWEHLALTRARVVAGDDALAQDVERFRRDLLAGSGRAADILSEVAAMRARIAAAKAPDGPWDAKIGPGRMQEIELLAQAGSLAQGSAERSIAAGLAAARAAGWLDADQAAALARAHDTCRALQMASRLLSERPLDTDAIGQGGLAFLLRATGAPDLDALAARLAAETGAAASVLDRVLPADEAAQ